MRGILLTGIAGYLFYNSWLSVILMIPGTALYLKNWQREQFHKKEQEFREQFRTGIQTMASAMNVGYSVENAIREASRDMKALFHKRCRIQKEFDRMIYQMDMNRTAEQVMTEFAERVNQEDVTSFTTVFVTAKRTGGDSITIMRDTVRDISGKIEVEKEIQTLLAARKLEFKVMCIIPAGIILYMRIAFPEFMNVLYGNVLGVVLMSICMGIYIAAYRIGQKIVDIEV
ncbi:type II secretion system F family protein [Faecalicatena orotica]|uniref:type II secretion system F family protein n=1 Tax=Faecalicatena orotica TaxID=1544 RepID=UPI003218018C